MNQLVQIQVTQLNLDLFLVHNTKKKIVQKYWVGKEN